MCNLNGRRGWSYIRVDMMGLTVEDIVAIDYKDGQKKENFYSAGNKPTGRGRGNYEASASITLTKEGVEKLQRSLPTGKRLTDIAPFDITICYTPDDTSPLTTDVIRNAEFTENPRSLKQGDMSNDVMLPLIVSCIDWNQ